MEQDLGRNITIDIQDPEKIDFLDPFEEYNERIQNLEATISRQTQAINGLMTRIQELEKEINKKADFDTVWDVISPLESARNDQERLNR